MAFEIDESLGYREQVKAYAEKIELFKRELAVLVKQMSEKRTEMATLAKKTLADYEAMIPKLEADILNKRKMLDSINSAITQRNEDHNRKLEDYKSHYQQLEKRLEDSYARKESQLLEAKNRLEDMHKKKQKEFDDADRDLRERERIVNESAVVVLDLKDKNKFEESKLRKARELFDDEIASFNEGIVEQRSVLESLKNGVKEKTKQLDDKLKAFDDKDKRAEAVLVRLKEVEERENKLVKLQDSLVKRGSDLDEFHVKLIAENRKIDLRLEELGKIETKLQEREKNIKLAEEKIAKGNNGKVA